MIDYKKLREAVAFIREHAKLRPRVALILGSGLGDFADELTASSSIRSSDIPHYPLSTVSGHEGKLIFGHITVGKKRSPPLLVFKGRVHFYETTALSPVVFPVYMAAKLGVKTLLVTNAAGGINRSFKAGQLMLIRDILSLTFLKLIFKENYPQESLKNLEWPLKSDPTLFDTTIQQTIRKNAERLGMELREGTYCWLKGPTYETAAEVEMLRRVGVDAVGMSTVPEILAARHLGLKVAGLSLISNLATGITGEKLSHTEVTDTANSVKQSFTTLLKNILLNL